ncbi:MAG: hypothetical protein ABI443_04065 [Chthoniobacterales bacterium]
MKKLLLLAALTITASSYAATSTVDPTTVLPKEWASFRLERTVFLRSNPKLVAQSHAINQQIKAQQAKVEAAMVKADPKVAPLLAKVNGLLKNGWKAKSSDKASLTIADWQRLRAARAAAFAANPSLAATNRQLMKQQKALGNKVDAALTKADPTATGFVSIWPSDQ